MLAMRPANFWRGRARTENLASRVRTERTASMPATANIYMLVGATVGQRGVGRAGRKVRGQGEEEGGRR